MRKTLLIYLYSYTGANVGKINLCAAKLKARSTLHHKNKKTQSITFYHNLNKILTII